MLEHGEAVAAAFDILRATLEGTRPLPPDWTLPTWLTPEAGQLLLSKLPSKETLALYQRYHDCGKPYCRQIDADGRQHFPNHALVSKEVWLQHGGSLEIAELIGLDMCVHLLKAEDVPAFAEKPQASALILTALAEVYANAPMFGGTDSTSFKIKFKHIERRGRQLINILREKSK